MNRKLVTAAYWAVPSIVCLILYWPGLMAWFQQDDFVWLNLINQARGWDGLLRTLFQPTVQGTWRPLSERVYFLVFGTLFGSDALPYRIWVFLTMFANLALAASVTARMTRSQAAGFWAAILWAANSKLATVMSWSCEYILVACGFFLLLALHFFLRYTEGGGRRYLWWSWAAFLTGFLAMETNIVFPALAATYALACARPYLKRTIPMAAASAVYGLLHVTLASNQGTQPYAMHFDRALPATFWNYWQQAFVPVNLSSLSPFPTAAGVVEMALCTAALAGFAVYQAWHKRWLTVLFLGWFAILLGPVVPLRDHITDYYLTLPVMGLAMAGAYALVYAWRAGTVWRTAALVLTAVFLAQQTIVARASAQWFRERGEAQEALVMGVAQAHELHPGKTILLDGIDDNLFWGCIQQRPFLFLSISNVYLTPGTEQRLTPHPEMDDISKFVLPAGETRHALDREQVVVYRVGASAALQNITHQYIAPETSIAAGPLRVDVADPLVADQLGPTWYPMESGFRWMPRQASVRMAGPRSADQKLYATAICPAEQLAQGPLEMTLTIDGVRLAPVRFTRGNVETTFAFALPAGTAGKGEIEIVVEVGRTIRIVTDRRDLGVAFGKFELK